MMGEKKERLTKFWRWLVLNHVGCREINLHCNPVDVYLKERKAEDKREGS